jgi:hydrogenase nickel insertion protein HypA
MHEVAVAQSIIDIVRKKAQQSAERGPVVAVRIAAGEFRNIDAASLLFAFDALKQGTEDLDACELIIAMVEAEATCRTMGHVYNPSFNAGFRCPQCGDSIGALIHGEELDVVGVDIQSIVKEERDGYARIS